MKHKICSHTFTDRGTFFQMLNQIEKYLCTMDDTCSALGNVCQALKQQILHGNETNTFGTEIMNKI